MRILVMSKLFKSLTIFHICDFILIILSSIGLVVVMFSAVSLIDKIFNEPKGFDDTIIKQIDDKDIRSVCINDVLYYKLQDSKEKVLGISVAYNKDGQVISCE